MIDAYYMQPVKVLNDIESICATNLYNDSLAYQGADHCARLMMLFYNHCSALRRHCDWHAFDS